MAEVAEVAEVKTEDVRLEEKFRIIVYGDKSKRKDEAWKVHLKENAAMSNSK